VKATKRRRLVEIVHGKSGDKGNTANAALIAYDPAHYSILLEQVTAQRVREYLGTWITGDVTRYEFPKLGALNFVITGALGGGGTRSLRVDSLAKDMSAILMRMEVDVPEDDAP
jgi:hypothetical protein